MATVAVCDVLLALKLTSFVVRYSAGAARVGHAATTEVLLYLPLPGARSSAVMQLICRPVSNLSELGALGL